MLEAGHSAVKGPGGGRASGNEAETVYVSFPLFSGLRV